MQPTRQRVINRHGNHSDMVRGIKIMVPSKGVADAFARIVAPLFAQMQTIQNQSLTLATSFRNASSHVMAQELRKIIVKVTTFTDEERTILRRTCMENKNVAGACYVPDAIYKAFGKPAVAVKESLDEEMPF